MSTLITITLLAVYILGPVVMLVVTWRDEREADRKFFSHHDNK